jgi:hypothetical protein
MELAPRNKELYKNLYSQNFQKQGGVPSHKHPPPPGAPPLAGKATGHQGSSANNDSRSSQSNDHVNSSLTGGITIEPPINGNEVSK